MTTLPFAFAFASQILGAPAAEDVAVPAEPPFIVCGDPAIPDPDASFERLEAAPGQRFVVRRTADRALPETGRLALRDGAGVDHDVAFETVRTTSTTISFDAPADLAAGGVYSLALDGDVVEGLTLRAAVADGGGTDVDDGAAPDVVLVSVVLAEGPADCATRTCTTGQDVASPRALLQLTYQGGPAILDAWALVSGDVPRDATPRPIDTLLLAAAAEPVTIELPASGALPAFIGVDLLVEARAVDDFALLATASSFSGGFSEHPAAPADDLPLCDSGRGGFVDTMPVVGCGFGPPTFAALLLPLGLRRLRRRRR